MELMKSLQQTMHAFCIGFLLLTVIFLTLKAVFPAPEFDGKRGYGIIETEKVTPEQEEKQELHRHALKENHKHRFYLLIPILMLLMGSFYFAPTKTIQLGISITFAGTILLLLIYQQGTFITLAVFTTLLLAQLILAGKEH